MLVTSLKDNNQFFHSYLYPALPFHFGNYVAAWNELEPYFLTSAIVAISTIVGSIILGSGAAFVFARFDFFGRTFLFILIAILLAVPSVTTLIPLFLFMRDLGLLNTRLVLILPYIAGSTILTVVIMRTFVEQLPAELFEASQLDGAGGFRMYWNMMLPLSLPIIGTVTLLSIVGVWNDYFWPLLTITQNNLRTVPVGLTYFQGQNSTAYGPLFAGYTIASVPLLVFFTFLSKWLLTGIEGGLPT
jgi:multiple sugar transport system permease protein